MTKAHSKVKYKLDTSVLLIADVLRNRGWTQVESDSDAWDLYWCEVCQLKSFDNKRLGHGQKIPHFRNHYELSRKNHLNRNLQRLKKTLLKEGKQEEAQICDCMPITFELPTEYLMFVECYRKSPGTTWIVKPAGGCQGRGIFLFNKLKRLNDWKNSRDWSGSSIQSGAAQGGGGGGKAGAYGQDPGQDNVETFPECWVVQKYIDNPYLIAGRKFDLRIYVVVISFRPLKVWVAREGFARFSGTRFDLNELTDTNIHLTNMAIQLNPKPTNNKGCKWSMRKLREFLTARHGQMAVRSMIQEIGKIILTSLQSVQRAIIHDRHCFELYGYDILLGSNLLPWLLEVNSSPSLGTTDIDDYKLKYDLIDDILNVLDFEGKCNGDEIRIGGLDLLWDDGPIFLPCPGATQCGPIITEEGRELNINLGSLNDREKQLTQLRLWQKYTKTEKKNSIS